MALSAFPEALATLGEGRRLAPRLTAGPCHGWETMMTSSDDRARRDRELFNTVAEDYARKDLHPTARVARKQRLKSTLAAIPSDTDITLSKVAEVGCGAGFAAEYLAGSYNEFLGLDYSANLIDLARRRYADQPDVRFVVADLLSWESEERFDVVFAIGVLHHLVDIELALSRIHKAIRPGGWLVVNEPQPGNPLIRQARQVRKRVDPGYSADQVELSARELEAMFTRAGFIDVASAPQGFLATPFAEVVLPLGPFGPVLSNVACAVDRLLERTIGRFTQRLAWNVVVVGRRSRTG